MSDWIYKETSSDEPKKTETMLAKEAPHDDTEVKESNNWETGLELSPDAYLTFAQLVQKYGFEFEHH